MICLGNLDVGEVLKMSLIIWVENEIKDLMVCNIFYVLCWIIIYMFVFII